MAVQLIEIHQVDEDHAFIDGVHRGQRLRHAVGVALRLFVLADAAAQEYVEDFANAVDVDIAFGLS